MLVGAKIGGSIVLALSNPLMIAAVAVTALTILSLGVIIYRNKKLLQETSITDDDVSILTIRTFARSLEYASAGGLVTGIILLAAGMGTAAFSLTNPVMWATVGLVVLAFLAFLAFKATQFDNAGPISGFFEEYFVYTEDSLEPKLSFA